LETLRLVFLFQSVACAFLCGLVAREKNREVAAWAVAGLFLGVLALIAVAGLPVAETQQKDSAASLIRDAAAWKRQKDAEKLKRQRDTVDPSGS
jgi:hypothetical protein